MGQETQTIQARMAEKEIPLIEQCKLKHNFETTTQLLKFWLYLDSDVPMDVIMTDFPDWKDFTAIAHNRFDEDKRNKVIFAFIFELMAQIKQYHDKLYPDAKILPEILSIIPEAVKDLQKRAGRHELDSLPSQSKELPPPFAYVESGTELYHILHGKIKVTRDGDYLLYKKEAFNLDGVSLESSVFIPTLFWEKPLIGPPQFPTQEPSHHFHIMWKNTYSNGTFKLFNTEAEANAAADVLTRTSKIKLYGRG